MTNKRFRVVSRLFLLGVVPLAGLFGCSSDDGGGGVSALPSDVKAIIFIQRVPRQGLGNVFDYTSYKPGGRIVKLEPPAADGKLTVLTSDPMFDGADFGAWDLSFDARSIVFSAHLKGDRSFHLYTMNVDGTGVRQITEGPSNYVYPIFIPGGKVLFSTNKVVEPGAPQFSDEYERATTAQIGVVGLDGTGETLGPRNVSHRVSPALLSDGRVMYTEWLHLGSVNDGHLRVMNADMTGQREAYGGEGRGVTNSYLKARYVQTKKVGDGRDDIQIVTIATSRTGTLQSGKLVLVDLNASEATAKATDLTPLIPGDREPSQLGIGRYYDAEVVGDPTELKFLTSWADGPVHSELLATAKTDANFGLYLLDGKTKTRYPIYDDPKMWDVAARPVKARPEPPVTESPISPQDTFFTVGALDVYDSSLFKLAPGSAVKVRLMEGFSSEEGFPAMFGMTQFDGQSLYGEVPVYADGSFAAKVPANAPLHMQVIDKFAMSMASEPVWISGRAGEQRFCGGCHEDRAKNSLIAPGTTEAVQRGAIDLDAPRAQRVSYDYGYGKIRGVPWDKVLQPMFDAKCISCHDGTPGPANPSYTIVDKTTMTTFTFTFNLKGDKVEVNVGEKAGMGYDFPASYISLLGVGEMLGEDLVEITGDYRTYVTPGSARESDVVKRLNPPQRFPSVDTGVRAFKDVKLHPVDVGGKELTPDEYYQLILNIDMGAQFYFRENKGGK